jgi:predicted LPLAT superfamily acyltransferase
LSWVERPERGSRFLLRFMVNLTLALGWRAGHALLYPITAYFLLTSRASRAASRAFLAAATGRRPSLRDLFRHHFTFSATLFDRVFLLTGRLRGFDIRVLGLEHLEELVRAKRGCVLLGAHLGSFEVLRAVADQGCPVVVRALMYEANAARVNEVLHELNPQRADAVIPIGSVDSLLRVKEALDRGELVGILGDRITSGAKTVAVEFLGRKAFLPTGPIILASALKVPVILFAGIHRGPRRYEVSFVPFADELAIDRSVRQEMLARWAQRYAGWLERTCRAHPHNWFNFYDFWADSHGNPSKVDDGPGLDDPAMLPGRGPVAFAGERPRCADGGHGAGARGTLQLPRDQADPRPGRAARGRGYAGL